MEGPKAEMFALKKGLYRISTRLTNSDLDKMKFMLSDYLPRQQLERAISGFDLLCLMASRDLLAYTDYSFLEEVLSEVGKGDCVKSCLLTTTATRIPGATAIQVLVQSEVQRGKLFTFKKFLGELGDNLSSENLHDVCQLFAGVCESINYQNVNDIASAEQLFSRLQDSHFIGIDHLRPLHEVFNLIGRLDLASRIDTFNADIGRLADTAPEMWSGSVENRVFVLPSCHQGDSLPETDSGSSMYRLQLKIEDQEKLLDQQEGELVRLRSQLKMEEEIQGHANQVESLKMDLKKKICEMKLLDENIRLLHKKNGVPLYDMSRNPHGLAVIIVNDEFCPSSQNPSDFILKPRKSATKDADCFSHTFRFLQYEVRLYNNVTAVEIGCLMSKMGSFDHSPYDSFVCCVSSHGSQSGIYGSDSKLLHRKAFIDPFKSCSTLRGKPKLFFFQACRVPQVSADSPEHVYSDLSPFHCDLDILIAYACTDNNPAYISPRTGSWFSNAIKLKLTDPQIVYVRTLQQILEEVTNLVGQASGQLPSGEGVNQCVEVITRMRKGVNFFTSDTIC